MKKYLALALIIALAGFAGPAAANITASDNVYTVNADAEWTYGEDEGGVKEINLNEYTLTLKTGDKNGTIKGDQTTKINGPGTLCAGYYTANAYGINQISNIAIDAARKSDRAGNMLSIAAAACDTTDEQSVSLTMESVTAGTTPMLTGDVKHYLRVAPILSYNRENYQAEIEKSEITLNNAVVGHSLFGGPLAIGSNNNNVKMTVNESVITIKGNDSAIGRSIYGGGGVWGNNVTARVEKVTINLEGGNITGAESVRDDAAGKKPSEAGFIYGGGLVETSSTANSTSTVGNVKIVISGGSVTGVRGGGRYEDPSAHTSDGSNILVDDVTITINGDAGLAAIGDEGVYAGGELVDRNNTSTATGETQILAHVGTASFTLKDIEKANSNAIISGEGATETADIALENVIGYIGAIKDFDSISVDSKTDVIVGEMTNVDKLKLTGDWTGVSEDDDIIILASEADGSLPFTKDQIDVSGATGIESFDIVDGALVVVGKSEPSNDGGTEDTDTQTTPSGSSSSSGGCSAGFGALALLAALPLLRMRKK